MNRNLFASTALVIPSAFAVGNIPTLIKTVPPQFSLANITDSVDEDVMLKRSPDSSAMLEYWDLTDTLVDGADCVRKAGEKYLPKFNDEDQSDYDFRLKMTKFTNVYRDIVEGLAAKPFEQEVSIVQTDNITTPSEIEQFIEDVDGSGNNLTVFSSLTFFNAINSAVEWIFVDYSQLDANIKTVADAKQAGLRPFWSHVLGRNVLAAFSAVINGKETLTYIKILEPGKPDYVRIFERMPDGSVTWKLFKKSETPVAGKTQFIIDSEGPITIGVIPLVPFATGRRDGRSFRYFPAMRDAADLQVQLYQDESGLKFAKVLTAYPMLAGNGVKPAMQADGLTPKKLAVGPARVLYAPTDNAGHAGSWAYVEPAATSLTFLASDIKDTINQLRELGRQPLTAQSGNLTVITTAVAAGKAKSAVSAWALGLKDALENALVITCMWIGIDNSYSPQVNVFTEFDNISEGKDLVLNTLNIARAARDISLITYWQELQRRGALSAEFDAETEEKRLLDEQPGDGPDLNPNALPPRQTGANQL